MPEAGRDLFRAVCEQGLEGVVAKHHDATYNCPVRPWAKVKNAAYSEDAGRLEHFERRLAEGA